VLFVLAERVFFIQIKKGSKLGCREGSFFG
jgi:hypothetical protein